MSQKSLLKVFITKHFFINIDIFCFSEIVDVTGDWLPLQLHTWEAANLVLGLEVDYFE
jgi:hypothetical protein